MKKKRRCPDLAARLKEKPLGSLTGQIIDCFSYMMLRTAGHRCRNPALAEDAYQEAVKTFIETSSQFRGEASIQTWLNHLVTSACSRLRRGRKNDPAFNLPLDRLPQAVEADEEQPGQELSMLLAERLEILGRALLELDETNRNLLMLHESQEVPLAELARMFTLTVDGVKARLRRTRARLRARLRKVAGGEDPI